VTARREPGGWGAADAPRGCGSALAPLVVKVGGSTLDALPGAWWDDLARLAGGGRPLVCVHGWSRQLAAHQRAHGREPEFAIDQHGHRSRLTDAQAIADIRVVAAALRARIARKLAARGLRAAGCAGDEDGLLRAQSRAQLWWRDGRLVALDNRVGPVREVAAGRLHERLRELDALVVSPLAAEARHGTVNSDGDRAAARIAAALGARRLVFVTDVPGVMAGELTLAHVDGDEVEALARTTAGGMRKKLRAAADALRGGVEQVHVGCALPSELLAGAGTVIAGDETAVLA
jgi:[amino group carrier protein]-L-2-aminoadipate/L-glutamate 6-kinase